jgi:magnesium transporter
MSDEHPEKEKQNEERPFLDYLKASEKRGDVQSQLFVYNTESVEELHNNCADQLFNSDFVKKKYWLNLHSLHDEEMIMALAKGIGLERNTVQNILDVERRPKYEEFDDYLFLSLRTVDLKEDDEVETEQISFVLGKGWLITFQERPGDFFEEARKRLRFNQGIGEDKKNRVFDVSVARSDYRCLL